ncbi:MAG: SGNH/GDSL hydrolase family protein [Saccharofermentanales bacterium]
MNKIQKKNADSYFTASEPESITGNISLISDDIILHGRILRIESQIGIDWSCSGIELLVKGGNVEVRMDAVDTDNVNCTHIAVFINGFRTQKIRLQTGNIKYLVAYALPDNKVTSVKLLKLNEVSTSRFTVTGIHITGVLQSGTAQKTRKIEFVGDSITTGYGNLCTSPNDPFWSETQDGTLAYPGIVADELDAKYNVVAAGGNGVYVAPKLSYKYLRSSSAGDFQAMWDFRQFKPDVIVINLGTNDIAQETTQANLDTAIKEFLTMVRTNNPEARIIWAYGLMFNFNSAWIRNPVEDFARTDAKVSYFQLPLQNVERDETGTSGHPNTVSHQIAADSLVSYIRSLTGWN